MVKAVAEIHESSSRGSRAESYSSDLVIVVGFTSNLVVKVIPQSDTFRHAQDMIVSKIEPVPGLTAEVVETYAEASAEVGGGGVRTFQPRTWDEEGVGTTRVPCGFLRFVLDLSSGDMDCLPWRVGSVELSLWADGSGVASFFLNSEETLSLTEMGASSVVAVESLSKVVPELVGEISALVQRACRGSGIEVGEFDDATCRTVGRHRLHLIRTEATAELRHEVARRLALPGIRSDDQSACSSPEHYCYAGNSATVEIAPQLNLSESRSFSVLRYYEYWIAALTAIDDDLYQDFVAATWEQGDVSGVVELEHLMQILLFSHRDVLNAMGPLHFAVWRSYANTWRVESLEEEVMIKIAALADLHSARREQQVNRTTQTINLVVTGLTALTLVSIVTAVAEFAVREAWLTETARWILVVFSLVVAVVIFGVALMPAWRGALSSVRRAR